MNFQEFDDLVVELAKKGETPAKIGLILRDSHGIPKSRVFETKITKILKAKGITYKVEKDVFDDQIKDLRKHLEGNKHDYTAKKSLTKKLWVLNRIERQRTKSI